MKGGLLIFHYSRGISRLPLAPRVPTRTSLLPLGSALNRCCAPVTPRLTPPPPPPLPPLPPARAPSLGDSAPPLAQPNASARSSASACTSIQPKDSALKAVVAADCRGNAVVAPPHSSEPLVARRSLDSRSPNSRFPNTCSPNSRSPNSCSPNSRFPNSPSPNSRSPVRKAMSASMASGVSGRILDPGTSRHRTGTDSTLIPAAMAMLRRSTSYAHPRMRRRGRRERAAWRESSLNPHCVSGTPGTSAPASRPKTKPISLRRGGRAAKDAARHPTAMWHPRRCTRRSKDGRHRRSVAPSASMNRMSWPRACAAPAARAAPLPRFRPWPEETRRRLPDDTRRGLFDETCRPDETCRGFRCDCCCVEEVPWRCVGVLAGSSLCLTCGLPPASPTPPGDPKRKGSVARSSAASMPLPRRPGRSLPPAICPCSRLAAPSSPPSTIQRCTSCTAPSASSFPPSALPSTNLSAMRLLTSPAVSSVDPSSTTITSHGPIRVAAR